MEEMGMVGTVIGMFDEDVCDLYQYKDLEGHIWEEYEQYSPWSSGPVIFLAIRNKTTGEEIGWSVVDRGKGEMYV